MQTLESVLAEHSFLKGLSRRHLLELVDCASKVSFEAGQYIFHQGEEANAFYAIRQGKVALEIFAPERGAVVIQMIAEGDVLGWSWLIPPHRWRFDARAVELTRAFAFNGTSLRTRCEEDPDFGNELLRRFSRVIAERLEATRLQLLDVYHG
jgi:CRP/FNR family cyclic AMP-dependent transcriptional regulator